MSQFSVKGPTLTILTGATRSNVVTSNSDIGDALWLALFCTQLDAAKTYKLQISPDGGTTWYDWYDGSANILPPVVALQASVYGTPGATAFSILASAAVASDCIWATNKTIQAGR